MARIRNIKPEFWKNEALSELPECTHMLAASLLNYADDEGYFNANPGLVRAECFPLRDTSVTVPVMLQQLSDIGYIVTYDGSDGRKYGHVIKFAEHQQVNKPKPSKIKPLITVPEQYGTSTGQLPDEYRGEGEGEGEREREVEEDISSTSVDEPDDADEAFADYIALADAAGLPKPRESVPRMRRIRTRLRDDGGIVTWRLALEKIRGSPFLRGEKDWHGATLDWLLKPANFTKVIEGNYDEKQRFNNDQGQSMREIYRDFLGDGEVREHPCRAGPEPGSGDGGHVIELSAKRAEGG